MTPAPKRRWFRFSRGKLFVVVTLLFVWLSGGWCLVGLSFAWGAMQGSAMCAGIRWAAPGARERETTRLTSGFVVATVLLLLFLPVVVGLVTDGIVTGLAQMAVIALGVDLAHRGCVQLFGPIVRPTHS